MEVTVYLPDGVHHMTYDAAVKLAKDKGAISIRRWTDAFKHEDFKNEKGEIVLQLETEGYPLLQKNFKYET